MKFSYIPQDSSMLNFVQKTLFFPRTVSETTTHLQYSKILLCLESLKKKIFSTSYPPIKSPTFQTYFKASSCHDTKNKLQILVLTVANFPRVTNGVTIL